jgi:hypothetical protein
MYPKDWKDRALAVKEAAAWKCTKCGHPHDVENGYVLTVHHMNGNKKDCSMSNLVAVCQRCHLRLQQYTAAIGAGQFNLFEQAAIQRYKIA